MSSAFEGIQAVAQDTLILAYSHNIIDHLGIKLYQNKPTRVIAELVSNSWDADAKAAWVDLGKTESGKRWLGVHDTGIGMSRVDLREKYLVIGAAKRKEPSQKSPGGRALMGRKGIGKLAPFGIATEVDLVTVSRGPDRAGEPVVHWLRLDLAEIKANRVQLVTADESQSTGGLQKRYAPQVLYKGTSLSALTALKNEAGQTADETGQVAAFVERVEGSKDGTGTLILLKSLTLQRAISEDRLIESLGRRLLATHGKDFTVQVNMTPIAVENSLPDFEFRIPEEGTLQADVDGHPVQYWLGFVKRASWPADEAGVGVYSHGKICQDRPFTFGLKGKEIFTRYMYGVVEAEWLDEQDDDLISTDRTSVNWDDPRLEGLHAWGTDVVKKGVRAFEKWRVEEDKGENKRRVQAGIQANEIPRITEPEQAQVVELLSEVTPRLGKDEKTKTRLTKAVATAWLQEPMRVLVHELWAQMGASEASPHHFTTLIEKLVENTVPESLNLAVVFAQRAFALTKLHDLVHNGREVDLQRLIEEFPWIIEPDRAYLTADQSLKAVVLEAEKKGLLPTGRRTNVAGVPDRNKPDFVFLSSPNEEQLVIVELKNPQIPLTHANRGQLNDYMTFLEMHYENADIKTYLIGQRPNSLKIHQPMQALSWTDVMKRARSRYIHFLAAMLSAAGTSADARVKQVRNFGGEETWALLGKMAERSKVLGELMAKYGGQQGVETGTE